MNFPHELYWLLPSETPYNETAVIVESLNGTMYVDFIGSDFYSWGDDIVRWAYFPDENYARYQNALSDVKYYKDENECLKAGLRNATENLKNEKELNEQLKKDVDEWFTKYLNLRLGFRELYDKYQRDASVGTKIKREFLDDNCGSVNSDGDECPATDDLCGVCKSDDARPVSEVSINEVRDIFLKVMREAKERERVEEDDGK